MELERIDTIQIGQIIRKVRKSKGETQQQLGEAVGVVQQSVAAWESNRCMPDLASLVRIAQHYNITTDQLLGLSGELLQGSDDSVSMLQRDAERVSRLPREIKDGVLALIRLERAGLEMQTAS